MATPQAHVFQLVKVKKVEMCAGCRCTKEEAVEHGSERSHADVMCKVLGTVREQWSAAVKRYQMSCVEQPSQTALHRCCYGYGFHIKSTLISHRKMTSNIHNVMPVMFLHIVQKKITSKRRLAPKAFA